MKKLLILFALPVCFLFQGCEGFIKGWDESPNNPTTITPALLLTNAEVSTFAAYTGQNARTTAILMQQCTGVTDQMFNAIQNYNIRENDIDNEWQNIYENGLNTSQTIINQYAQGYPYYLGIAKIIKALNLGLATDLINEVDNPVNPLISALLFLTEGSGTNQAQCPPLELIPVLVSQSLSSREVFRLTDDLKLDAGEAVLQAVAHQVNSQMGNINAEPAPVELLRRHHRRPAAAEGVKDNIAFIGACLNDTLKKSNGFLSFITKTF